MNPALLQHTYPIDYSLNTDTKYVGQDRTYPSSTSINNQDHSQISRRHHDGLNNTQLGHALGLPTNTGLDYTTHPLIQDNSYHSTTHLLLSPPPPIDGASTTGLQPTSSSFNFSSGLKLVTSNVSSTDHFVPSATPFLSSAWPDSTMTNYSTPRRLRGGMPPTLSPPINYNQANSISGQYHPGARTIDQYTTSHSFPRPFAGSEQSHDMFRQTRNPSFNLPVIPHEGFPVNGPYSTVPLQPLNRPDGPSFDTTKSFHTLVTGRQRTLEPEISASIQKGFFQVDGKWTCYRRNYFAVSCAFSFKGGNPDEHVYLQRHSQLQLVQQYAVSISAQTGNGSNQDSEKRELVQHTPKRDKATESVPGRHIVQPAPVQSYPTGSGLPVNSIYPGNSGVLSGCDGYSSQNHHAPTSYTFERIQFQKATANNGKRRAQQQFFHVVVELSVKISQPGNEENWVIVASKKSDQMVVRGRSPGHYKDSIRRDSQADNDPDRSSGTGGDSGSASLHMAPVLGSHSSSMDWPPSHRQNHHYGHSYSRQVHGSDGSPGSASSSTTLTASPIQDGFHLPDFAALRPTTGYDLDRSILNPILDHGSSPPLSRLRSSFGRKGSFEEESSECEHDFYSGTASADNNFSPQSFDFNNASNASSLCAST